MSLLSWLLLLALWLALISLRGVAEIVTGSLCASAAIILLIAARRHGIAQKMLLPHGALRQLWSLPLQLVTDTLKVSVAILRQAGGHPVRGHWVEKPLQLPYSTLRRRGLLALSTYAASFAPGEFVIGTDEQRGLQLVHQLVGPVEPS